MRMFETRGGTRRAEDVSDANKATRGGSNTMVLEGERVSFSRVRPGERPRGQLDDLRRRRVDAGGAERAEIRDRTDHLAIPIEERRVDREAHEKRVDRRAGLDRESIAFAELSPSEKAAHPLPRPGGPFDPLGDHGAIAAIQQSQARTSVTRGPSVTSTLREGGKISPSRKWPNGLADLSSTDSATASSKRSRRAGRPKSSRGISSAKARGPAVSPRIWNAPGCSVARRKGRRRKPASATDETTTP